MKIALLTGVMLLLTRAAIGDVPRVEWKQLQAGLELATITLPLKKPMAGDNTIVVVRVDPRRAKLKLALASLGNRRPRTAREWCADEGLAVAINAGMFKDDGFANVGRLVDGDHVNSRRWVDKYRSALVFGPRTPGLPAAAMIDLDAPADRERTNDYRSVVQNLRLVKGPGQNVWTAQDKRWSEAAIAVDKAGRVLFLFARTPFTMAEFNAHVLELPLGVERAMHVEGGPEASLSIHTHGVDLDYFGSYETSFMESDDNKHAWDIPNVLGVVLEK